MRREEIDYGDEVREEVALLVREHGGDAGRVHLGFLVREPDEARAWVLDRQRTEVGFDLVADFGLSN